MPEDDDLALDIDHDERFLRREHQVNHLGWILLTLFVLAGLLGLLGAGPLSTRTSGEPGDAVRIEHQRVSHFEAEDALTLYLSKEAIDGDTLTVELTGDWLKSVDMSSLAPDADAQRIVPGGVIYEFAVEEPADVEVVMSFRPQSLGDHRLTATAGGSTVTVYQFVLP